MRAPQSPKSWLGFLWLLPFLFGCGQEGIKEPVPDFQAPQNIDAVAGKVVREAHLALEKNPQSPEAWSTFANACLANEMASEAINAYEVLISHNPKDADSIWRCAFAYSEVGDLEKAIQLAEGNHKLFNCQAEYSRRLSRWHFDNGNLEQAKQRLEDRTNCQFVDYWMDVLEVEILIGEGNFEDAKRVIQKYSPPFDEDLHRLAELTARRLDEKSWSLELSKEQPNESRIPPDSRIDSISYLSRTVLSDRRRANTLVQQTPTPQTLQQLKLLHDARPNDSWFAATYAMHLLRIGQVEDAALTLAGLTLNRDQWTAEYWMVTALVCLKQYEKEKDLSFAESAAEACINVIEIDPNHLTATTTLAKIYRILRDYNAESKTWKDASELANSTEDKLTYIGASFQATGRAGDWTRASSLFDLLIEEVTKEQAEQLWGAAAQAAINAGREDKARQYIERLRTEGYEDVAKHLEKGLK